MKRDMIVKYIKLYFNNIITKCVADAIQISKLLLGEGNKVRGLLLADAVQNYW
jgi:hypothetical protein